MGKPTSCLKLIACGSDAADKDDCDVSQVKESNDKRCWSFRKRSARHRVLSNNVILEAPSSTNRENAEQAATKLESPSDAFADKITAMQRSDEKQKLSALLNSKTPETFAVKAIADKVEDDHLDDSSVVVIQTAIRGLLAQKELLKLKNAVKLQAAVRGHLVRRYAVGTLRCVQAIVKMQALVRAHQRKENHLTKRSATYSSFELVLRNSFARQLLECTPTDKHIHIKCDPSKDDSAWKWLERWMSIATAYVAENVNAESLAEQRDVKKEIKVETEDYDASEPLPDSVSTHEEATLASEVEENANMLENMNMANDEEVSTEMKSHQYQNAATDTSSQKAAEVETAPSGHCVERFTSEQQETKGKKQALGPRKSSNPTFIAAQSKFEELSSSVNSSKANSMSHHDTGLEVQADAFSAEADSTITTKQFPSNEDYVQFASRVQVGGSECGTELSVTSTLNSPDTSVTGADNEHEGKCTAEDSQDHSYVKKLDNDAKVPTNMALSDLSKSIAYQPDILDDENGESVDTVVPLASENGELMMQRKVSGVDGELVSETVPQDFRSSVEASPQSHVTIPDSQGTPSSQISIKHTGCITDKSGKNYKRKSLSGGKKSPAHAHNNSGYGRSGDETQKEQITGKRRNSFGSVKPDQNDQEPRSSSSSKDQSIPHFMQATESARAKMNAANNSPRSSPDMNDRDIYIKKRHSLPSATGRQGSPRIQRSISQAQHEGVKERKWQR